MAFSRTSALRAGARANPIRPSLRSSGPRLLQRIARRTYADGGHHTQAKSNDLTWGLGAAAVTIPGAWYLLQPSANGHHGDDHGHAKEEHEEEHEEETDEAPKSEGEDGEQKTEDGEQQSGEEEPKEDQKDDQKDEPKVSESEGKGVTDLSDSDSDELQNTKVADENDNTSKNETHVLEQDTKGTPEGVRFKGKTNQGDEDNEMTDTRKHVPDAKGGAKKRIDSGYAKSQSVDNPGAGGAGGGTDRMAEQQKGLSNTETKHSTDIKNSPEKSKKGEGSPETSKTIGTVKVDRPQSLAFNLSEHSEPLKRPVLPPRHCPPQGGLLAAGTIICLVLTSFDALHPWPRNAAVSHLATISFADALAAAPSCAPTTEMGGKW
ncbi:MAG: hypothetical protein Q9165_005382 [Trypethelium subeluteriae]